MNNFLSVYGIYNPPVARETRVKWGICSISTLYQIEHVPSTPLVVGVTEWSGSLCAGECSYLG